MNILITGSSGYLGKVLVEQLSQNNTIIKLSRYNSDMNCDLSISVPNFTRDIDLVIHAAGLAHTKGMKNDSNFFKTNVNGTKNLLEGLSTVKSLKKIIFISSVAVYGASTGILLKEDHAYDAKDAYGLSKIFAEKLILEWASNLNIDFLILRLPLVVHKNPPGNLGEMIKSIKKGVYFNIDSGKAKKSMILATDVARFIHDFPTAIGIYNLTDDFHPSFMDVSKAIAKKNVKNIPFFIPKLISLLGDFLGDRIPLNSSILKKITSDLTFDNSKAKQLGWMPNSVLKFLEETSL